MAKATSTPSETFLNAAAERLSSGEYERALASMLEAWRESGDGRMADAIDRLSSIVTAREKPIVAVGGVSAKKAWFQAANSLRPAILGRLLEVLPDGLDRDERLEALMKWPPDPRIGTAARAWLITPPVKGKNRPGFFNALWKLIDRTRDRRAFDLVSTVVRSRDTSVHRFGMKSWVGLNELAESAALMPPPMLRSPDMTHLLERIEALIAVPPKEAEANTSASEAELYERIYADPSDDEPRAVLADLLQQRGDPRGEFIALQLARAGTGKPPTSAEKKLLQQWMRDWLGPLATVIAKNSVRFDRGFLAKCTYPGGRADDVLDAREWSTVTHLDIDSVAYGRGRTEICLSPRCRNVRTVTGLDERDYEGLPLDIALPWTTTTWLVRWQDRLGLLAGGAGKRFAAVRTLIVAHHSVIRLEAAAVIALLEAWPNVEALEIATDPKLFGQILASPRGKKLNRLTLQGLLVCATAMGDDLHLRVVRAAPATGAELIRILRERRPRRVHADAVVAAILEEPMRELGITLA